MLSLVSTWMGDRLGTLGAVGILLSIFFSSSPAFDIFFKKKMKQGQSTLILECIIIFFIFI